MSKFKVGDVVQRIPGTTSYGSPYSGGPVTVRKIEGSGFYVEENRLWHFAANYMLVTRTLSWDNLQVGDVIYKPGCKNDYVMIDVFPNTFHAQGADTTGTSVFVGSKQSYINSGWKIRGAEPKRTELTLDEIADKFGIPVKTLKIKK